MKNSVGMKRSQGPTECVCVWKVLEFSKASWILGCGFNCRPQMAPWDKGVACLGCSVKGGVKHH